MGFFDFFGSKRKVVVLPGILGSDLAAGGKTVWELQPTSVKLDGDALHFPGSLRPTGLTAFHRPLVDGLTLHGFKVLPFPYDWRRKIEDNATDFAAFAGGLGDFDIVAHSMGGLIARIFAAKTPAWQGRLIMLGTPHLGSWLAAPLLGLAGGEAANRLSEFLSMLHVAQPGQLIAAAKTWPAAYELLPHASTSPDAANLYAAATPLLQEATAFHQRLDALGPTSRMTDFSGTVLPTLDGPATVSPGDGVVSARLGTFGTTTERFPLVHHVLLTANPIIAFRAASRLA